MPTNVGPPPISPISPRKRPARQLGLAGHRPDDAEALGRVVQAEADDQDERERELAGGGRLADREPLAEVVQADPGGDQEREPPPRA